jgi:hypothetical protein
MTGAQMKQRRVSMMKMPRRWPIGVCLVGFGVVTLLASIIFGQTNLAGMGLASLLIGLLVLYLPSQSTVAPELVGACALSSFTNLERFLREMSPLSKAIYLKVNDRLDVPQVYLPMSDNSVTLPPVGQGLTSFIVSEQDRDRTGLVFEAPGGSLLVLMEKEAATNFYDVDRGDILDILRASMVESVEAVDEIKGAFTDRGLRLKIKEGVLLGMYQSITRSALDTASRIGCPICSAAICAIVKSEKKHARVENAGHELGYHDLTLTFL